MPDRVRLGTDMSRDKLCSLILASTVLFATVAASHAAEPKLVLLVTVDALRGDMPWRFKQRLTSNGFRRLMDQGVAYSQAHYRHSTTFTAVGHATIATGGNVAQHGLAGNDWYDQVRRRRVYCVEDEDHMIIGQAPQLHEGTSPRNLTSSTFGDELVLASGGRSRVFSVSMKDRGAILTGGHLGKAFWYSNTGNFVTSTFYYDQYPDWVDAWNKAAHAERFQNAQWTLLHDRETYIYAERDDRPTEFSYKNLGRVFPHPLGNPDRNDFHATLRRTPMGDELTLDFVQQLMTHEKLGQTAATDVLAVSLSATDYIGHAFGPNSLEWEDNMLRLDRSLAGFFEFIDKHVGLDKTLIVLSSDHGMNAIPEHLLGLGMTAGRHDAPKFIKTANAGLKRRFTTERDLVIEFLNPSLYLDVRAVAELGLDVSEVERALAKEMLKIPGFALASTRTDLLAGNVTSDPILAKVQRAFHPRRSGNVMLVQDVSWYLSPNPRASSAMHGSPYAYDTYVPIMFAGPGIPARTVHRSVGPEDIAPTITGYLGIKPPSGSTGTPLTEVLNNAGY